MKTCTRSLAVVWALMLAVALFANPASAKTLGPATAGAAGTVVPATYADGLTGAQLLAQVWTGFYETPTTAPPVPCLYAGATGKVLVAGNHFVVCDVSLGQPVMYFFGGTCDSVSPPPYYAVRPGAQRRCARAADVAFVRAMSLRVDGGHWTGIRNQPFVLTTTQQHVDLPADNIDGVPAGPATFTAHAWGAFVTGLSLGTHTIVLSVRLVDGTHDLLSRTIRVVA